MPNSQLPTQILLSLSTAPLLLALIGGKALGELIQEIGQASEEVFRGDRLPVLKISNVKRGEGVGLRTEEAEGRGQRAEG